MPFDLGATVRLTAECRDPGGTLTTAATATVTVTLPDGTAVTPDVTTSGTGTYQADYVTAAPGRHTVRWVFAAPAAAYTDVFDVAPEAPPAILSLADAKKHLNINNGTDDDEIRFWNNAATRAVEFYVGPVVARTITEDHAVRGAPAVVLLNTPVLQLTAITAVLAGDVAPTVDSLGVDGTTGEVYRLDGGTLSGRLRFAYTAGRTVIGEHITGSARIILDHLWRTQRAGRRGAIAGGGGDDYAVTEPIPGLGYAVPNRAVELLAPDRLPPGVA